MGRTGSRWKKPPRPRAAPGTGRVLVGRICMDQSMVDMGPDTREEWAKVLGTICCEATCQLKGRVERVFDP